MSDVESSGLLLSGEKTNLNGAGIHIQWLFHTSVSFHACSGAGQAEGITDTAPVTPCFPHICEQPGCFFYSDRVSL